MACRTASTSAVPAWTAATLAHQSVARDCRVSCGHSPWCALCRGQGMVCSAKVAARHAPADDRHHRGNGYRRVVRGSDCVVSFRALADAGRLECPTPTPGAALLDLAPPTASVLRPGGLEQTVQVNEVGLGSRFIVSAGERIPLDGRLTEGASAVNQAPSPARETATLYNPKSRSWKQLGYGYRFVASWKFRKIANCEAVQFW
jgi:hypothetical protein